MRALVPIIQRFHGRFSRFSYIGNRNWILRRILWLTQRIYCLLTCQGEITTALIVVDEALALLRAPDVMAKKTIVTNLTPPLPVAMGRLSSGGFNHIFGAPHPAVGQPVKFGTTETVIATVGEIFSPQGPEYEYYTDLTFNPSLVSFPADTLYLLSNPVATIYENGKIVALIEAGESRELQLSGRYMIEARAAAGQTLSLEIATYRHCDCGEGYIPPYGQAVEPIGGDLI